MVELKALVKQVMQGYVKKAFNGSMYLTTSDEDSVLVITAIGEARSGRIASTVLATRVAGDSVIVEADNTNRPLVDALLEAGLSRDRIVLAYLGEPLPQPAP